MKTINLSPSKLETWRKYQDEEYGGFITKEKVIEAIKGEGEWSDAATFGSAFQAVIEHGAEKFYNESDDKFHVQDDQMPSALILEYSEIYLADKFHKDHPAMIHESRASLDLVVDNYKVHFSMRLDAMEGTVIHENKTSSRYMKFDFFESSYQYKVYFLATGATACQYNIFAYDEPNTKHPLYRVYYDFLTLFPYPDLEAEVKNGIRGVINFCEINGISDYLIGKDYARKRQLERENAGV